MSKMRVILWGINYAPEATGIGPYNTDLCEHLTDQGNTVEVVTAFSYYPHWRKKPEDQGRLFTRENQNGVTVNRCWLYVPKKLSTATRIIHELSFCFMSFLRILFMARADVYVVVSPPLALGFFAWIATSIKRSKFVFHVQDLQPDAAAGMNMIKPGPLLNVLYGLERIAYRKASLVSGISEGMIETFRNKKVPAKKISLFPNWFRADSRSDRPATSPISFREKHGIKKQDFLAFYSGNLGRKQGSQILLDAGELLSSMQTKTSDADIFLLIIGEGAGRADLELRLANQPIKNVRLLPLLNDEDYRALLATADVALITQAGGTGRFFFPSKLLSVLHAQLPVLTVADEDSELARAVESGGFGLNSAPGDAKSLAQNLMLANQDRPLLRRLAAKTNWVDQYSRSALIPAFEQELFALAGEPFVAVAPATAIVPATAAV